MKNRDKIKNALLLSMQEKMREECKDKGMTKRLTEETISSCSEYLEQSAEVVLAEYESFLLDSIATTLVDKIKNHINSDSKVFSDSINNLTEQINSNHGITTSKFTHLNIYHFVIRKKILEAEVHDLNNELQLLEKHKLALNKLAKIEANKTSWVFVFLLFVSLVIWCALIYKFGWDSMEKWTYISALALVLLNGIYYAVFERNFTSESLRKEKLQKSREHIYQLYKFEDEILTKMKNQIESREKEINELEEKITATNKVHNVHAS